MLTATRRAGHHDDMSATTYVWIVELSTIKDELPWKFMISLQILSDSDLYRKRCILNSDHRSNRYAYVNCYY